MNFTRDILRIDPAKECECITGELRRIVRRTLGRQGGVVGISGGVDSSVVLALAVRAFGKDRVQALILPEKESDCESEELARTLAEQFGISPIREDITAALDGLGCYQRRDEAICRVFPKYDPAAGYRAKISLLGNLLEGDSLNVFSLTVVAPDGSEFGAPLAAPEFLQIMAASNFKQRTRMAMLYYHAELNNFAVIGTANKNEQDQGFFVKFGDAGVDVKAIAHLYKTQVYQLAEYLDIPEEIRRRPPTTDTYSAPCDQQEFFFRIPFETLDLLWFAQDHQIPLAQVSEVMGLTETIVQRAFNDFTRKQRSTQYLRSTPLPIEHSVLV